MLFQAYRSQIARLSRGELVVAVVFESGDRILLGSANRSIAIESRNHICFSSEISRLLATADSISRAPAHLTRINAVNCDRLGTPLTIDPGAIDRR